MSIVVLKRKAGMIKNLSASQPIFSLNGTTRSQGYVGQTSLSRPITRTTFKSPSVPTGPGFYTNLHRNHGGCCGHMGAAANLPQPLCSSDTFTTEDSSVPKMSVLSEPGMLHTKYRWIHRPQPYTTVKNMEPDGHGQYTDLLKQQVITQKVLEYPFVSIEKQDMVVWAHMNDPVVLAQGVDPTLADNLYRANEITTFQNPLTGTLTKSYSTRFVTIPTPVGNTTGYTHFAFALPNSATVFRWSNPNMAGSPIGALNLTTLPALQALGMLATDFEITSIFPVGWYYNATSGLFELNAYISITLIADNRGTLFETQTCLIHLYGNPFDKAAYRVSSTWTPMQVSKGTAVLSMTNLVLWHVDEANQCALYFNCTDNLANMGVIRFGLQNLFGGAFGLDTSTFAFIATRHTGVGQVDQLCWQRDLTTQSAVLLYHKPSTTNVYVFCMRYDHYQYKVYPGTLSQSNPTGVVVTSTASLPWSGVTTAVLCSPVTFFRSSNVMYLYMMNTSKQIMKLVVDLTTTQYTAIGANDIGPPLMLSNYTYTTTSVNNQELIPDPLTFVSPNIVQFQFLVQQPDQYALVQLGLTGGFRYWYTEQNMSTANNAVITRGIVLGNIVNKQWAILDRNRSLGPNGIHFVLLDQYNRPAGVYMFRQTNETKIEALAGGYNTCIDQFKANGGEMKKEMFSHKSRMQKCTYTKSMEGRYVATSAGDYLYKRKQSCLAELPPARRYGTATAQVPNFC